MLPAVLLFYYQYTFLCMLLNFIPVLLTCSGISSCRNETSAPYVDNNHCEMLHFISQQNTVGEPETVFNSQKLVTVVQYDKNIHLT